MNGTLPDPPDDLTDTKEFRRWVVDRLSMMPCIQNERRLQRLEHKGIVVVVVLMLLLGGGVGGAALGKWLPF